MSQKSNPVLAVATIFVFFLGWQAYQAYQIVTRVSDIERAEFRVLYAGARDRLDAFSGCRFAVGKPIDPARLDVQIELQKKFSALRSNISDSRFSSDQKLLDLEIQLKNRNPQTEMDDEAVRCARLSPFASAEKKEVSASISDVENFLEKY